jgi:hypothetical protein
MLIANACFCDSILIDNAELQLMYEIIKDLLGWIQGRADRNDEKVLSGLRSLMAAILATKKYEEFHVDTAVNRQMEFELAELWAKAAVEMREINNDLAMRLGDKSRYWSEPVKWGEEMTVAKRIKLVSLDEEVQKLLKKQ